MTWAVEQGITNGAGANARGEPLFDPGRACSGTHIATFIYRAIYGLEASQGGTHFYSIADQWIKDNGLANNTGYALDKGCTRADTVTFLYRFDKL